MKKLRGRREVAKYTCKPLCRIYLDEIVVVSLWSDHTVIGSKSLLKWVNLYRCENEIFCSVSSEGLGCIGD